MLKVKLLMGLGVSFLGNWLYLVALNLYVLQQTDSAAAVAALFMMRPIATLMMNGWVGSVVDRFDKRTLLVTVDVIRGVLVACLPFIHSLWLLYSLLLLINMFGSVFGPAAMSYMAKVVSEAERPRFNAWYSTIASGAFVLGSALAGTLLLVVTPAVCIWLNAVSFLICAAVIMTLPRVEHEAMTIHKSKWATIRADWQTVRAWVQSVPRFFIIYFLFQVATLIGFALDAQEVTFLKWEFDASDSEYSFIVALTGAGALAGSFAATALVKRMSTSVYLVGGLIVTMLGYVVFYAAPSLIVATIAFISLGFFMSFASTGYMTWFQTTVPSALIGRCSSMAEWIQAFLQLTFTFAIGVLADWWSLQAACLTSALVGSGVALLLLLYYVKGSKVMQPLT